MNNFDITQRVILEKMLQQSPARVMESNEADAGKSNLDNAYQYLNKLIEAQQLTSARPVLTRKKGLLGKIAILFKKVVRKATFWYVEPICKSQTYYNEISTQFDIQMFYQLQKILGQDNAGWMHELETQKCQIDELRVLLQQKEECERVEHLALVQQNERLLQELGAQKYQINELRTILQQKERETCECSAKLAYVAEETRKLVEDMQLVKQEAGDWFKANGEDFWNKVTVAQSGEDSIIAYVLMVLGVDLSKEYYLDLGANHAKTLSNTYMLYKKGMRGVLVDANPKLVEELKFYRNEDIVLNKCIAEESGTSMAFYILNGDGLSSMDLEAVNEVIAKNPSLYIEETIMVEAITVNDLMEQYFTKAPLVLNVDVEGMEEEILCAIDYEKYAPLIIVVERIEYDTTIATEKRNDNIEEIMAGKGYFEYAFTGINSIYINRARLEEIRNENRI